MRVAFHRFAPGGHDAKIADVWIDGGRVQSNPPEFAETLGDINVHGTDLTPSMGDRYLHGLLAKYEHGTYLRASEVNGDADDGNDR